MGSTYQASSLIEFTGSQDSSNIFPPKEWHQCWYLMKWCARSWAAKMGSIESAKICEYFHFQEVKGIPYFSKSFVTAKWKANSTPVIFRVEVYLLLNFHLNFQKKILGTFEDCRKHPLRMLSFSSWWFRENAIVGFIAWHNMLTSDTFLWFFSLMYISHFIKNISIQITEYFWGKNYLIPFVTLSFIR